MYAILFENKDQFLVYSHWYAFSIRVFYNAMHCYWNIRGHTMTGHSWLFCSRLCRLHSHSVRIDVISLERCGIIGMLAWNGWRKVLALSSFHWERSGIGMLTFQICAYSICLWYLDLLVRTTIVTGAVLVVDISFEQSWRLLWACRSS